MIRIFISYSHEDKVAVEKLAKQLESRGYEVWWDTFLIAGQDYREKIALQLATADNVIVVWSSHPVRSPFVIDEAQRANKLGKLIPIVIDVSDPPMGFGHLHTVSSKDIAAEFDRIEAAIEDRTPISAGQVARTISLQRIVIGGLLAFLLILGIGFVTYRIWKTGDILVVSIRVWIIGVIIAAFSILNLSIRRLNLPWIEFDYPRAQLELYNKIIGDMTLDRFKFE